MGFSVAPEDHCNRAETLTPIVTAAGLMASLREMP